jgi:hypothetical protein
MTPKKCVKEPIAVVPKLARVGFFFSHSMYSGSVLTPIVGETQNAVCTVPARVTGIRSVCGSNGIDGMVSFCTTVADGM